MPHPKPQLAPFASLAAFNALDATERLALAAPLAQSLGKGFRAGTSLVGSKGMVAVDHAKTGVQLVAVPGGSFDMGFTERDDEEVRECVDYDAGVIQETLQKFERMCSPVHTVAVSPFLLSSDNLKPKQVAAITDGATRSDILSPTKAALFAKDVKTFRLPSEAELEYVGREGGTVAFVNDVGRVWSKTRAWADDEPGAWGFVRLSSAAWAADQWHENYKGAPSSAIPWTDGGTPSVYRGRFFEAPTTEEGLLFALAACRGKMVEGEDEWEVGLRVALSINV